jgi:multidrug transporter EmrE-like cation transporter
VTTITPAIIGMMILSAASQLFGIAMLPLSQGFTKPLPTLGALLGYLVGLFLMARMAHAGVNLSLLVPVLAALIPIGSIVLSVAVYGEAASVAKLSVLVVACLLIGVANML